MKQQIHSGLWLVGYHGGGGLHRTRKSTLGIFSQVRMSCSMRSLFCRNIQLKAELRLNRETLSLPVVLSPLTVQFGWRPKEKIMDESSSNLFLLQNFWAYPLEPKNNNKTFKCRLYFQTLQWGVMYEARTGWLLKVFFFFLLHLCYLTVPFQGDKNWGLCGKSARPAVVGVYYIRQI